jgi:hypothetical protein
MIVTMMVLDLMQQNGCYSSYTAQSHSIWCKWLYDKLGIIWEEMVMVYIKMLSWYMPRGTNENKTRKAAIHTGLHIASTDILCIFAF